MFEEMRIQSTMRLEMKYKMFSNLDELDSLLTQMTYENWKTAMKFKGTLENSWNKDSDLRKLSICSGNWNLGCLCAYVYV